MSSGALYILLSDPEERGEVDGSWAAGLAALSGEAAPPVVTEPRIAHCVRALVPGARLVLPPEQDLCLRLRASQPGRSGLLELFFLRDRVPEPAQWKEVRSYGLRSAVLGALLAENLRRSHRTCLSPSTPELNGISNRLSGRRQRENQWRRTLEGWVLPRSAAVEVPDRESGEQLNERHLPSAGKIRVAVPRFRPVPKPAADRSRPGTERALRIAVLASRRHPERNRQILHSIRRYRREHGAHCDPPVIHWLARRGGYAGIRVLQTLRRYGLAANVLWEDEPWMRPPPLREDRWDLLILAENRFSHWPLAVSMRAVGGRILGFRDEPGLLAVLRDLAEAAASAPVPASR